MLVNDESIVSACFRCAEQPNGEGSPDPSMLPGIGDDESHLGTSLVSSDHVGKSDDVAAVALVQLRDEREPPQVVDVGQRAEKRFCQRAGGREKSKVSRPWAQTHEEFPGGAVFP